MTRPLPEQPGKTSIVDIMTSKKLSNTQNKLILVQHKNLWYRVDPDVKLTAQYASIFDAIVVKNDDQYNIVKDRYGVLTRNDMDRLLMEVFFSGKTLEELPRFYDELHGIKEGPVNLYKDSEGNLVAMTAFLPDDYDSTN